MALVIKDRVKETTTTTGTGTLTLAGAASGYQSFAAIGNANTTYYAITDQATGDWEVGIGTYTATGTTLSRDTILASSNSGAAVTLAAGIKNVFATYPAGKAAFVDDIPTNNNQLTNGAGYITGNQTITLSGDVSGSGTTSIAVTVADDSHNHVISNVDGLQTALDAKQAAATALTTSTTFGGDVSGTYNSIAIANDSHSHTGSTLSGIAVSNLDGAAVQTSAEAFADVDTALMTAAAIEDRITGKGYLTGNQTITLSGDASGSGTTSIAVTVANDSHTHDTRYYTETEIGNFFSGTTAITGYSKTNWDTAYGWGNHASAGYLTGNQTITLSGDVSGSGTTAITVTVADDSHNHVISNVDGLQTALDGKSSTSHNHTLDSLSNTTITSNTSGEILKWNGTAWINNTLAEAGIQPAGSYLTGNQTITLSGDATGSGTTAITVAVVNDSHSHTTSTLSGNVSAFTNDSGYVTSSGVTSVATSGGLTGGTITSTGTISISSDARPNANQYFGGSGGEYFYYDNTNSLVRGYVNSAEVMRLYSGTTGVHFDGDVIAYSTTISDKRLKDNIETVEGSIEKLKQIRGVTFTRKHNGEKSAGVVAQEVEKVLPEAVKEKTLGLQTGDEETLYKVVEYDALHALLIEAVKELADRVEELEAQAG